MDYICTDFDVDSSSRFLSRVQPHRQTHALSHRRNCLPYRRRGQWLNWARCTPVVFIDYATHRGSSVVADRCLILLIFLGIANPPITSARSKNLGWTRSAVLARCTSSPEKTYGLPRSVVNSALTRAS